MEQWLIYLIVFVLLIVSSINKKKKQVPKPGTSATQPPPKSSLEDFFEKLSKDEYPVYEEEKEKPQPFLTSELDRLSTSSNLSTLEKPISLSEQYLPKRKERIFNEKPKFNFAKTQDEFIDIEFSNPEDLKKAVVFAEILNRKYF